MVRNIDVLFKAVLINFPYFTRLGEWSIANARIPVMKPRGFVLHIHARLINNC
jgi:hypothetical protein